MVVISFIYGNPSLLFFIGKFQMELDKLFSRILHDHNRVKLAGQRRTAVCSNHHISTKALRTLILETIRAASTYALLHR